MNFQVVRGDEPEEDLQGVGTWRLYPPEDDGWRQGRGRAETFVEIDSKYRVEGESCWLRWGWFVLGGNDGGCGNNHVQRDIAPGGVLVYSPRLENPQRHERLILLAR